MTEHEANTHYLDFELEIAPGEGREYALAVLHSPAGEARGALRLPFDDLALERYLDKLQIALLSASGRRRAVTPEEQVVQEFGGRLFEALLAGEVRSCYDVSQERARQQGAGLRLKLRIQPPELARLPWEFLYDARRGGYVCLSANTPVVRYLELPQPAHPLALQPPLRVLGMVASPRAADLPALEVETERERLERALQPLQRRGLAELTWLENGSWRTLQRKLRQGPWHIFHFVGHGRYNAAAGEGELAFETEARELELLGAERLATLLADHRPLRLALLNACEGAQGGRADVFSSAAATLVRRGLPAVVAMQYAVTDQAAIEIAQAFYEALADGLPADAAVAEARKALHVARQHSLEWGTPVLYMHTPDGVLFQAQTPPAGGPAAAGQAAGHSGDTYNIHIQDAQNIAVGPAAQAKGENRPEAPAAPAVDLAELYEEGSSAYWLEDWEPAVNLLRQVEARQPGYQQAAARLKEAEGKLAQVLKAREAERQEEQHREAEQRQWSDPQALLRQAVFCMDQGEWGAAGRFLRRVQELQPQEKRAATLLRRVRQELGEIILELAPGVEVAFVRIPAGPFLMGAAPDQVKGLKEQGFQDAWIQAMQPQHTVALSEYWIARAPATVAQFRAFVQARGYRTTAEEKGSGWVWNGKLWEDVKGANWLHPHGPQSEVQGKDAHPATQVSWLDAAAFCAWLSQVSGQNIHLPGEAQWEKAARGTDGRLYPWGDEPPNAQRCNFGMNVGDTTPVGQYSPLGDSPYGCLDMAGNVWEWCADQYAAGEYARRAEGTVHDPTGPASGPFRVARGGAWVHVEGFVRSVLRYGLVPSRRLYGLGFRPSRSP